MYLLDIIPELCFHCAFKINHNIFRVGYFLHGTSFVFPFFRLAVGYYTKYAGSVINAYEELYTGGVEDATVPHPNSQYWIIQNRSVCSIQCTP